MKLGAELNWGMFLNFRLSRKVAKEVFAVKHFYKGYENLTQMPKILM
jgi:hypothetical protein